MQKRQDIIEASCGEVIIKDAKFRWRTERAEEEELSRKRLKEQENSAKDEKDEKDS